MECYVPITTCNFKCHYCYITMNNKWKDEIKPIGHSPEEIRKALSQKRLGGCCLINICGGGETLLCPDIAKVIREILEEGHYVSLVTNGTVTKVLKEISEFPSALLERLMIKFSYHYLEQHRLNLTEHFFSNVKMMWEKGCSFTLEITPNDELIPYRDKLKEESMKYLGAICHVTIARDDTDPKIPIFTKLSDEEFYQTWSGFDSNLFQFKKTIFGKHQDKFCYAGEWSAYVNLGTGDMTKCYYGGYLDNIYKNPDKPLHFEAVGCKCPTYHCYNGHSFLALGDIPEMDSPSYAELRNRETADGKEWLGPGMKEFLSGKLKDSNKEYSRWKKWSINRKK